MSEAASGPLTGLLKDIAQGMPITADLSRSDLLLVRPMNAEQVVVLAQAQPHSISPLHTENLVNRILTIKEAPVILDAWHRGRPVRVHHELPDSAPIRQDVRPIRDKAGRMICLLSIETSLIQLERHRQRHASFRRAIDWLKAMCARGELAPCAALTPFGDTDGVLLVDYQRRITYVSGIANNLYRRLGYMEDLRGQRLSDLNTGDDELVSAAVEKRAPLEEVSDQGAQLYIRKVLPVWPPATLRGHLAGWLFRHPPPEVVGGVLIMVHDATEERRKRQELQVKTTMIQEVHHRVKNNLQTIAAVLRMQTRRAKDAGTEQALKEATNRILSVAVIHEFLSLDENQSINVRDVCQRIVAQTREVLVPGLQVNFSVEGPAIYLPSQQATACALIINELVQNALEHGFENKKQGEVRVMLTDSGDGVGIKVWDDGHPLPEAFSLDIPSSLGLQIVRSLVESDLHGQLKLENLEQGVAATVTFPKAVVMGKAAAGSR